MNDFKVAHISTRDPVRGLGNTRGVSADTPLIHSLRLIMSKAGAPLGTMIHVRKSDKHIFVPIQNITQMEMVPKKG